MAKSHGTFSVVKKNDSPHCCPVSPGSSAKEAEIQSILASMSTEKVAGRLYEVLSKGDNPPTLRELCSLMLKVMLSFGLSLLVGYINLRNDTLTKAYAGKICPNCGCARLRRKKTVSIQRRSWLGVIRHQRTLVECGKCRHVVAPLDLELKTGGGHKNAARHEHGFVSLLVYMCTLLPFERGTELFQRATNQAVSSQLAEDLCEKVGGWLVKEQMNKAERVAGLFSTNYELFSPGGERFEGRKAPRRIYVMQDNRFDQSHDGKRGRGAPKRKKTSFIDRARQSARKKKAQEAKRGIGDWDNEDAEEGEEESGFRDARAVLIFTDEDIIRYEGGRTYLRRRRVLAHIGTLEEWTALMRMVFLEEGVFWAAEVVFIADGGSGIWQQFADLVPETLGRKVYNILDWYHAASHLYKVALAVKGGRTKGERLKAVKWVTALVTKLEEGRPSVILQRLRKIHLDSHKSQETVRKCIKYFECHQSRMHYAKFRRKGLLVGSGAVESIHAWVIQARMRLSDMRWSVRGANRMLRLRCAWASGTFDSDVDAFMATQCAQECTGQRLTA